MTKPYYECNGIVIYHEDCREILPELQRVDCVITDPPYGINYKHGASYSIEKRVGCRHVNEHIVGDDILFDPSLFLSFNTVALFGANNYSSKLPDSKGWIVWNKRSGMLPMDASDCELIWTNKNTHIKQFEYMWSGVCRAGEAGNISLHPTQKPLALMKYCIQELSQPTDTILDPFMGSGTTLVAAKQLGRKAIGIEIEEWYCEIAARRLVQEVLDFS